MALSERLESIVSTRREGLPEVERRISTLEDVERLIAAVQSAASDLPADWQREPSVREGLDRLSDSTLLKHLAEARESLEAVRRRYGRETVNIGVSGRARVGKSLMLQSVSGLSDEQVPTGSGTNVTATRSRIFHSATPRAEIEFHSSESFLDQVVRPYYADLGINPAPVSLAEFRRGAASLERQFAVADEEGLTQGDRAKWRRLIEINAALDSLPIDEPPMWLHDLSDLRRYVAYPTTQDKDREDSDPGFSAPRDYLAVRDCRIEAPFPVTTLDRLGLVDLPGLGESASGIDERIGSGLSGEVDVVLMVFRSVPGLANIDTIDRAALDLITRAQGSISDSRDFAWVVVNAGPGDDSARRDLVSELQRDFNTGEADSKHVILTADASSEESMHSDVLIRVLERLSERLPVMDTEVLAGAVDRMGPPLRRVVAVVEDLRSSLRMTSTQSGSLREQLDDLADELHKDMQRSLGDINTEVLVAEYLEEYLAEIEGIHGSVRDWLTDGLGRFPSRAEWIEYAEREWGRSQSHVVLANRELHRLRVEINRRYAQIDSYLNETLVEGFYAQVCAAIAGPENDRGKAGAQRVCLLGDRSRPASEQLVTLIRNLETCDPPVPTLAQAAGSLSGIRFDFRLQSYPVLLDLAQDVRPEASVGQESYPPDFVESATGHMHDWLWEEFIQYSRLVKNALKEDADRQMKVLAGAVSLFEDEVVRSGRSGKEFRNLVDGYRDELWPGKFDDINSTSARARQLLRVVAELEESTMTALEAAQ